MIGCDKKEKGNIIGTSRGICECESFAAHTEEETKKGRKMTFDRASFSIQVANLAKRLEHNWLRVHKETFQMFLLWLWFIIDSV